MLFRLAEQIRLLEAVDLKAAKATYEFSIDTALYLKQDAVLSKEAIASLLQWTPQWGKKLPSH